MPSLSCGTGSGGGAARFGSSTTACTAVRWRVSTVRLPVLTLGSEMLIACPSLPRVPVNDTTHLIASMPWGQRRVDGLSEGRNHLRRVSFVITADR